MKKVFFAADFHLGLKTGGDPVERERRVVRWLDNIAPEAAGIYLLGDIFDFWWEYKRVVPKGFTRFLGTVASLTDAGIPVHFFPGNHDMWVKDYFTEECGMTIHEKPLITFIDGKKFYLAHGDGLGTQDTGYKILLVLFHNKLLRKMYSMLHPAIGVGIGYRWSLNSRLGKGISTAFLGDEKEDLIRYAHSYPKEENINYFIFGHRHLQLSRKITDNSELIILGDWIRKNSYAVWDGKSIQFMSD